jgi:HEAT repeat protein
MRPFRPLSPEPLPLLPEITALLDHPDENTRRNAARAIRKINTLPQ